MNFLSFISWLHVISASISLILGAIVLYKRKGNHTHKKTGIIYFYAMLLNAITALFIFNVTGKWFFAHTLALVTLVVIIPGVLITHLRKFKYWLKVHILCFTVSYYLLIGGGINEAFLRIPFFSNLTATDTSIIGLLHLVAQLFFISLLIYFLIKYKSIYLRQV